MRLPVVAAITVPKTNQRGEVILGPGSKTQCGLIESRDAVSDPGVERGQGGHVETEEQAEKEAKQSAERRLKLSLQSLPFCSWAPDEHGWRQEATRLATLHDFFTYLVHSPPHPVPDILVRVASISALYRTEKVVDVAVLGDAIPVQTPAQFRKSFVVTRVAVYAAAVGLRPHDAVAQRRHFRPLRRRRRIGLMRCAITAIRPSVRRSD